MRQRNTHPYPLICPTLSPPAEVAPGDEIDAPEPLAGFEPVDATEPDQPPAHTKATKKSSSKAASPAGDTAEVPQ